jgi:pyruvate-formate lyase-activating enzyme
VLIPGYVDSMEVGKIARFISSVDKNIPLRIDAYWPIASKEWRAPSEEEMSIALNEARKYLKNVSSLTGDRSVKGEVIAIV